MVYVNAQTGVATMVIKAFIIAAAFGSPMKHIDISKYNLPYFIGKSAMLSVTCHREMEKPLLAALACTKKAEIKHKKKMLINYAGCYVHRRIHGSKKWSNHRWGLAIDLNVTQPVSKLTNNQHPALVKCFEDSGFTWGGRWENKDYMHFEYDIRG